MSHLHFSSILFILISHTYSKKPNFLVFVIFLLTQSSAIFASCGLLVQSHLSPPTATAPSCCPLPPLSLPPPAPPPPLYTIEAAHRRCSLPHPTPQPSSAVTVHSCCAPSLSLLQPSSSTIEAAHHQCSLLHPTPQLPSAATFHSSCALLPPPLPLPSSHSHHLLPPSTVAVHHCRCHRCCRCPNPIHVAVQRQPRLVYHQK
jgi:hypothetical protein